MYVEMPVQFHMLRNFLSCYAATRCWMLDWRCNSGCDTLKGFWLLKVCLFSFLHYSMNAQSWIQGSSSRVRRRVDMENSKYGDTANSVQSFDWNTWTRKLSFVIHASRSREVLISLFLPKLKFPSVHFHLECMLELKWRSEHHSYYRMLANPNKLFVEFFLGCSEITVSTLLAL